jgi:hypothetical protein
VTSQTHNNNESDYMNAAMDAEWLSDGSKDIGQIVPEPG